MNTNPSNPPHLGPLGYVPTQGAEPLRWFVEELIKIAGGACVQMSMAGATVIGQKGEYLPLPGPQSTPDWRTECHHILVRERSRRQSGTTLTLIEALAAALPKEWGCSVEFPGVILALKTQIGTTTIGFSDDGQLYFEDDNHTRVACSLRMQSPLPKLVEWLVRMLTLPLPERDRGIAPLPWITLQTSLGVNTIQTADGYCFVMSGFKSPEEATEVTRRIVRAVNGHHALYAALSNAQTYLEHPEPSKLGLVRAHVDQVLAVVRNSDPMKQPCMCPTTEEAFFAGDGRATE